MSVKREVEYVLCARSLTHLKLLFGLDRSISCGLHNVWIEYVDCRFIEESLFLRETCIEICDMNIKVR